MIHCKSALAAVLAIGFCGLSMPLHADDNPTSVPIMQSPFMSRLLHKMMNPSPKDDPEFDFTQTEELPLAEVNKLIANVKKGVCKGNKGIEVSFGIVLHPDTKQPVLSPKGSDGLIVNIECDDD